MNKGHCHGPDLPSEEAENIDEDFDFQMPILKYCIIPYVIISLYLMACLLGLGIKAKHISGC